MSNLPSSRAGSGGQRRYRDPRVARPLASGSRTTFAADASEIFGDADGHREGARQQEGDADDERHQADEER
jgi:hypothetical protein